MLTSIILLSWLLLLWLYFLWTRRRFYKAAWQLRGPIGLPFIGMGPQMMNPETFLQYMEGLTHKYQTPFISWMGTSCFLYVNDPQTMETIFNSTHCTNKGDFYRFMSSAIGDGLFTSSAPRWHKHRRLINPAFSRQILCNFLPIFNAEAQVLLNKLETDGVQLGKSLEIYEILKKIVLEAACQTTMGKKMNFQHDGSAAIFEAYNGITEVCVKRMLSPWLYPDVLYRHSSLFVRQQQVVGVLFGFVEQLLQLCGVSGTQHATGVARQPADVKRKSKSIFIEQVRKHVEQGQLSWQDLRDEANVIIAATFETTSTALYFTILCLAMHTEYQDKLHEELINVFPAPSECHNANITLEQLEQLNYTEAVINEAMRLFAPVPMVLRRAEQPFMLRRPQQSDSEFESEFTIPQGTQIGLDIFNMQRDKRVWGPLARTYNPDAHFGPQARPHHAFAFVPFTKGLRMCIGYRYALLLMKLLLAKIFRHYRIRTDAKMADLIIKGTISLKLREYPMCRVERRYH